MSDDKPPGDAHELMPPEIAAQIPKLYSTEKQDDPTVWLKLFTPDSSWTWYGTEYDPEQRLCFGLADGHEREWGYFSLEELESLRGPLGLKVERDLYWNPVPMSKVLNREVS